jgi:hypothetical protein
VRRRNSFLHFATNKTFKDFKNSCDSRIKNVFPPFFLNSKTSLSKLFQLATYTELASLESFEAKSCRKSESLFCHVAGCLSTASLFTLDTKIGSGCGSNRLPNRPLSGKFGLVLSQCDQCW